MIPIEDRLANHLTAVADYVDPATSDSGAATVIHGARRRQFHRRRIATMSSALLLIGTAITIPQLTSGRDPQRVIAGNGPADSSSTGDIEQAPSPDLPLAAPPTAEPNTISDADEPTPLATDLTWIHHDGAHAMSGPRVRATDGTFYSIGTMPVAGSNPPVTMPATGGDVFVESVFKSADCIAWTPAPALNARMEDIYYGTWDASTPRSLYGVGTEPARSPLPPTTPGGVLVARIVGGDAGNAGNVLSASPDLPALNATTKMEVVPGPTATGALGTLMTATLRPTPFIDGQSPNPDEISALGRFGLGDALLSFAADGQHFDEVYLAPVKGVRMVHNAWATATGYSIVTTDSVDGNPATKTLTVHSSVDGRQWTTGSSTTITAPLVDTGVLTNGRMMFTGIGGSVTEVTSTDGVTWTAGARIVLPNASVDGTPLQSAGGIYPQMLALTRPYSYHSNRCHCRFRGCRIHPGRLHLPQGLRQRSDHGRRRDFRRRPWLRGRHGSGRGRSGQRERRRLRRCPSTERRRCADGHQR